MPPSAQAKLSRPVEIDEAEQVRRTRERAEKRLQTLTKEVDWRIAKAYVALAESPDEQQSFSAKQKESGLPAADVTLEGQAVAQYLDDEEWEQEQRRLGSSMKPPAFPFFSPEKTI